MRKWIIYLIIKLFSYEKNYKFLNPKFIRDEWDEQIIPKVLKLAKRIKNHNPEKQIILIFDDSIGLAKSLFKDQKAKRLITTLRHYNVSIIVSTQQIQNEVTTLLRNNANDVFMFSQSENYGIQLMYESYGKPSNNLNNKVEFEEKIMHLPKHTFLHYNRGKQSFQESIIPYSEMPDFRIYLIPEDKNIENMITLYGNSDNYELSSVEKDMSLMQIDDSDDEPLFRQEPNSEDENKDQTIDIDEDLIKDLIKDRDDNSKSDKKKNKKRKRKQKKEIEEEQEEFEEEIERSGEPVFNNDIERTAHFRCKTQLNFAKNNPVIKSKVESVYPDFFNQSFDDKSLQELLALRRKMFDSFQVEYVVKGCKNQYEIASLALKMFAQHGIGYDGPNLQHIDYLFNDHIALSTLESLGKVKPGIKYSPSPFEKIIDVALPSMRVLWNFKNQVEMSKLFQTVADEEVPAQDFQSFEEMLP